MGEPGQDLLQARHIARQRASRGREQREHPRPAAPKLRGLLLLHGEIGPWTRHAGGGDQLARHVKAHSGSFPRQDREIRLPPRLTITEQPFIAPHPLDNGVPTRIHAKAPLREPAADLGLGERADHEPMLVLLEPHRDGIGAVVPMERHMVGDEKATRRPGEHIDAQVQLMAVEARPTADGN
jgi:hypothetical protein